MSAAQKTAILAQVGHFYFGAVGQFYVGANTANSDFALSRGFGGFCARTQALRNTLSSLRGIRVRFVGERAAGRESNAANVGFSVL